MTVGRILYIEPFSGISGDMFLAALLDLGVNFGRLQEKLAGLPVEGYRLSLGSCSRAGIRAARFEVHVEENPAQEGGNDHTGHHHGHHHRSFRDIRELIASSGLSPWVKEKSTEAFRLLAEAEGKIHDRPADEVHFHEVGAVDSIVDIVGAMIALEELRPLRLFSAPVNVGGGALRCRHGLYPAPGPAAAELLIGIPVYSGEISGELTTPTGAALLAALVERFGPRPPMKIQSVGYGAGMKDFQDAANVLRVSLGREDESPTEETGDGGEVAVIETTIDDMNPQVYGHFQEKALEAGALDVYATAVHMKKNRPGIQVTIVCPPGKIDSMSRLTFDETTTIGVRYTLARRRTLERRFFQVETPFGAAMVKVSYLEGRRVNFLPEYESCRRLAAEKGVPLKEVLSAAGSAYLQLEGDRTG